MTPREEIRQTIQSIIIDAFKCGFDAENSNALDHFDGFVELRDLLEDLAIGRWVSVEERLPKDHMQTVITQWSNSYISYYTFWTGCNWCVKSTDSEITHWLELDLPSRKEEA